MVLNNSNYHWIQHIGYVRSSFLVRQLPVLIQNIPVYNGQCKVVLNWRENLISTADYFRQDSYHIERRPTIYVFVFKIIQAAGKQQIR